MVLDHSGEHPSRWAAVTSITAKIGCTPQTLHYWGKKAEVDSGQRAGVPTDMAEKLKALERGTASFGSPTRSCARQALILRRRSSTAGPSHDRLHRRSSWGA
jgi:transposase